jgi:hypothetical protein
VYNKLFYNFKCVGLLNIYLHWTCKFIDLVSCAGLTNAGWVTIHCILCPLSAAVTRLVYIETTVNVSVAASDVFIVLPLYVKPWYNQDILAAGLHPLVVHLTVTVLPADTTDVCVTVGWLGFTEIEKIRIPKESPKRQNWKWCRLGKTEIIVIKRKLLFYQFNYKA